MYQEEVKRAPTTFGECEEGERVWFKGLQFVKESHNTGRHVLSRELYYFDATDVVLIRVRVAAPQEPKKRGFFGLVGNIINTYA